MGTLEIIIGIAGIIIGLPPFLDYVKKQKYKKNDTKFKRKFTKLSVAEKIVLYIWNFPVENKNQSSWAVKESQIILGNLEYAKEKPGLGIAILSVEFALKYFKEKANSRIENCINWALIRTQKTKPYFILYEKKDENISLIEKIPDFRHSIAFGIILSLTKNSKISSNKKLLIDEYLKFLIDNQHKDGGWTAGKGQTVSELFSCIYAIELIIRNSDNEIVNDKLENVINSSILWLIKQIKKDYLWGSNVFNEYWDMIFTSTWVLNRLIPLNLDKFNKNWNNIVKKISLNILDYHQKINWNTKDEYQRFRLEARIAASLNIGKTYNYYDKITNEQVDSFIKDWKERTNSFMKNISYDNLDLATSLFLAEPLLNEENIIKVVEKIN